MQLTLVVPDLLDLPAATLASLDARAPALSRLLRRGSPATTEVDGLLATACRVCGIARQDDWPVAPRLARAAGIDPADAYWLCADPATLAVGADDVRLSAIVDDLPAEDARALIAALNAHFAPDRIVFVAPSPARWFLRASESQRLRTRPPEAALGAPLFGLLPSGPDSARWRRWQNEMQMLLFDHPVNRQREREGAAPVNSVWLWGGGAAQPIAQADVSVLARESRIRDLARGSAVDAAPPPPGFDAVPNRTAVAVWLDPIGTADAQRKLEAIDRAWMAPVERALDARRLSSPEIVAGGRDRALRFQPRRSSLVERWRARLSPPCSLDVLAAAASEAAAR